SFGSTPRADRMTLSPRSLEATPGSPSSRVSIATPSKTFGSSTRTGAASATRRRPCSSSTNRPSSGGWHEGGVGEGCCWRSALAPNAPATIFDRGAHFRPHILGRPELGERPAGLRGGGVVALGDGHGEHVLELAAGLAARPLLREQHPEQE